MKRGGNPAVFGLFGSFLKPIGHSPDGLDFRLFLSRRAALARRVLPDLEVPEILSSASSLSLSKYLSSSSRSIRHTPRRPILSATRSPSRISVYTWLSLMFKYSATSLGVSRPLCNVARFVDGWVAAFCSCLSLAIATGSCVLLRRNPTGEFPRVLNYRILSLVWPLRL